MIGEREGGRETALLFTEGGVFSDVITLSSSIATSKRGGAPPPFHLEGEREREGKTRRSVSMEAKHGKQKLENKCLGPDTQTINIPLSVPMRKQLSSGKL